MAETEKKIPAIAKLQSNRKLRELMTNYYLKAKLAANIRPFGHAFKKVAWITSGGPVELLIAMGVTPIYPENHGAIIGASKEGAKLCDEAEKEGYSRDLCSYFRCDVGHSLTDDSPLFRKRGLPPVLRPILGNLIKGGLPRPDFFLCCNNICGTVLKWYEVQSRYYNVPLLILDTPYNYEGPLEHLIDYVHEQFKGLIPQLEKLTGTRFDMEEFKKVGLLANDAINLWNDILSSCGSHVPAPMSCFDAFIYLAPIVTLRGTTEVLDYYTLLKKELQGLMDNNESVIGEEKFRLVWDNLPIWYKMRKLSHVFQNYGACLVGDTYTNAWADNDISVDDPLLSMARAYSTIYLNRNIDAKIENMVKLIKRYKADGFVLHSNRSCKPYSFGQYDIKEEVSRITGLPGLIIEADMTDERSFSDEQIETRIQAYMETLNERKSSS